MSADDPIVAIATASGRGAVGIVRVSGHGLRPLIEALCGELPEARRATVLPFFDADRQPLDRGLAIHFPAPHSYTGEDVLELQAHGGVVLLQLLLARCLEAAAEIDPTTGSARLPGLRIARPGEFTERAFLNDKLDLAQAEAVADLIDASTEAAARSASRSLSGAFSIQVEKLRDALIELRMLVEATLDFPEEEIDFLERADAQGRLARIVAELAAVRDRARQGVLLREGIKVVLAGQPNVGKSSLLNALAGAELAIVTPIPGTTRDKVAETIQIQGVPIHVVDTAGLRESNDEVERIGVARSWGEIGDADVVVFLHDLSRVGDPAYDADDARLAERLASQQVAPGHRIDVYNKADIAAAAVPSDGLRISARTGQGLDTLAGRLLEMAGWRAEPEGVFIARTRHLDALQRTAGHLRLAEAHALQRDAALELFAEELRLAHDALGEITGAFTPDDLLGVIFSRFCIGK
ncbi:MAG: tRNA uridine-5-carboxymethylaminomethyl(34) synthesis GTPase MnmE [Caldimonas sp.]